MEKIGVVGKMGLVFGCDCIGCDSSIDGMWFKELDFLILECVCCDWK